MEQMEVDKERSYDSKDDFQTQLQEEYLKTVDTIDVGQVVEGTVVQVTPEQVFVDVGCKSEGKISIKEFSEVPKIGDIVTVELVSKEDKFGDVLLSKQKADSKVFRKKLRLALQNEEPIDGVIKRVVKGGYEVELASSYKAFLPSSQASIERVTNPEKLINTKSKFLIERLFSNGKQNLVVNCRKYLEKELIKNRDAFFATAKIGDVVTGTVKSFTSFGAFVDLGGFDGLLHINDMSWGHVTRPKDYVKKGQEIKLKVIRLDPEEKRINLSLKHFIEDPWLNFEDNFRVNDIVDGKVTKLTDYGAFIELKEGIEGLAHISEFSWVKKIDKPEDMLKIGQEVKCMILGYDIVAGRVSLGIKQTTPNPWNVISKKYPAGTKISGTVEKFTNNGAFINIGEDVMVFLNSEDYSWTKKLRRLTSELTVGQSIDVVVIEVDPEAHNICVGVKQLTDDPWKEFTKKYQAGSFVEGEITAINEFGIFVKVPEDGLEGLINKTNAIENREQKFEDVLAKYKVGDKINAVVVDINPDKQKVSFSIKDYKKKLQRDEISRYISADSEDEQGGYTLGDMLKKNSK